MYSNRPVHSLSPRNDVTPGCMDTVWYEVYEEKKNSKNRIRKEQSLIWQSKEGSVRFSLSEPRGNTVWVLNGFSRFSIHKECNDRWIQPVTTSE